jgi:hypothetical protein
MLPVETILVVGRNTSPYYLRIPNAIFPVYTNDRAPCAIVLSPQSQQSL